MQPMTKWRLTMRVMFTHAATKASAYGLSGRAYSSGNDAFVAKIVASDPEDSAALFEPAKDKIYRHPTFYEIPEDVGNM